MGLRVFLCGLFLSIGIADGGGGWPMFQHDRKHTGRSSNIGPSDATIIWKYETGNIISTSPSVDENKTVYFGTLGGVLFAIDSSGNKRWEFPTTNFIRSAPALVSNMVFFGSYDKFFYSLNVMGETVWMYSVGDIVSGASTVSGSIIAFPAGVKLVALSTGGALSFKYEIDGSTSSSPAIGDDGTVYFQTHYGNELGILAVKGGSRRWLFSTPKGGESSPAIGDQGTVYVGDNSGRLYALNPNSGDTLWSRALGYGIKSSPAIGADGTIYIGSDDYRLYAIGPDGTIKWSYRTGNKIFAAPVIDGAGNIYVGSLDSIFYSFSKDGALRWYQRLDGPIEEAAAIGPDGSVYVGTRGGTLYAFHSKAGVGERGSIPTSPNLSISPNPFSSKTSIEYQLPLKSWVELEIYDVTGILIKTIFTGEKDSGIYRVTWERNGLSPGLYFCRLKTRLGVMVKKVVLF